MALAMEKLYKNCWALYDMKLVAGKQGLQQLVQWVHIIEDEEVISFLHGGELVFTAGIRSQSRENWLLNFAKDVFRTGGSALVVNIGPHIQEIPPEVIGYCNEIRLPLFTIPWKTRMVDMTRDFCRKIIASENEENSLADSIRNILFGIGERDVEIQKMERYGVSRYSRFCFFSVVQGEGSDSIKVWDSERIEKYAEKIIKEKQDHFIHFLYQESLFLVLVNFHDEDIWDFADRYLEKIRVLQKNKGFHIGVSENLEDIEKQRSNFENAHEAAILASKSEKEILYYENLGIYKILLQVKDKSILREYYDCFLGKVDAYDRENGTELRNFINVFLECNGSTQMIARRLYIHRNTVTNQIRKIEKITGYNIQNLDIQVMAAIEKFIENLI